MFVRVGRAMPCQKVSLETTSSSEFGTVYNSEAACLEACKDGACCTVYSAAGPICDIRPECLCQEEHQKYYGKGTTCASTIGACCLTKTCITTTECECLYLDGTFKGFGTTCEEFSGGCCTVASNGSTSCSVVAECACAGAGQTFYGIGTDCEYGACCVPDGVSASCQILPRCVCESLDGTFKGAGTTCTGVKCTGACCLQDNGGCTQTTQAGCDELVGNYRGTGSDCTQPATNNYNNPSTAIITITGIQPNMIPWPEPGSFYYNNGAADYAKVYALNKTVTIPFSCPQNIPVCSDPPFEQRYDAFIGYFSYLHDLSVAFYILDGSCEPRFIVLGETTSNFPVPTFGGYRKEFESGYVGCNRSQRPELCGGPFDLTNAEVTITYA